MKTIKTFIIIMILMTNISSSMINSTEELLISFEEVSTSTSSEKLDTPLIKLPSPKTDSEELKEIFEKEQLRVKKLEKILKELDGVFGK